MLAARALPNEMATALLDAVYEDADPEIREVIDEERAHQAQRP